MGNVNCDDCGTECVATEHTPGYAVVADDNRKVCYDCAAKREKAGLLEHGEGVFYLGDGERSVVSWGGLHIAPATVTHKWRVQSWYGTHMHQVRVRIGKREFTGRGWGVGMSIALRETAASRKAHARRAA